MSDAAPSSPLHSELPFDETWDLAPRFPDDAWERAFVRIDDRLNMLLERKGRLPESPSALAQACAERGELERSLENLYAHAHLKAGERGSDSAGQNRPGIMLAKLTEIHGETAWFEPEILALSNDRPDEFEEAGELTFYRRTPRKLPTNSGRPCFE